MSASQVSELAAAGMEIGSHSATHARLAGIDAGQLEAEVGDSKASIGELVGAPIRGFAYPYGSMDAAARHAVRDAGYDYACAVQTAHERDSGSWHCPGFTSARAMTLAGWRPNGYFSRATSQ